VFRDNDIPAAALVVLCSAIVTAPQRFETGFDLTPVKELTERFDCRPWFEWVLARFESGHMFPFSRLQQMSILGLMMIGGAGLDGAKELAMLQLIRLITYQPEIPPQSPYHLVLRFDAVHLPTAVEHFVRQVSPIFPCVRQCCWGDLYAALNSIAPQVEEQEPAEDDSPFVSYMSRVGSS
jgi:hypothetical protein